jgi:pyridoxal phosphate enzyme (YggS family)
MNIIVDRFKKIQSNIHKDITIVAVSKTFNYESISPLVEYGHKHFGENKVQEAEVKWREIKKRDHSIQLHMIGKLQSNKAKKAVELFDYIHSLDTQKLVDTLCMQEMNLNKKLKYFIQVNVGAEIQKSGVAPNEIDDFYTYCKIEKKLNVIGLMAIPPNDEHQEKHYEYLSEVNSSLGLKDLSTGMSNDYLKAIKHKATYIRLGSSIFGNRS